MEGKKILSEAELEDMSPRKQRRRVGATREQLDAQAGSASENSCIPLKKKVHHKKSSHTGVTGFDRDYWLSEKPPHW